LHAVSSPTKYHSQRGQEPFGCFALEARFARTGCEEVQGGAQKAQKGG